MLATKLSLTPFQLMHDSVLDELKPDIKPHLFDSVLRYSIKNPQREDITAPFFISIDGFTQGDIAKQHDMLQKILDHTPHHRSALWLLGSLYEESPETAKRGIAMKKQAVELGVERVFPVTDAELTPYQNNTE
jgi:hypothetical protein